MNLDLIFWFWFSFRFWVRFLRRFQTETLQQVWRKNTRVKSVIKLSKGGKDNCIVIHEQNSTGRSYFLPPQQEPTKRASVLDIRWVTSANNNLYRIWRWIDKSANGSGEPTLDGEMYCESIWRKEGHPFSLTQRRVITIIVKSHRQPLPFFLCGTFNRCCNTAFLILILIAGIYF